jgi:pimeloyl-ACP methyl ester carboxylesterase
VGVEKSKPRKLSRPLRGRDSFLGFKLNCAYLLISSGISITMTTTQTVPVKTAYWQWRGFPIRYQQAGDRGEAIVLIHGFGASSDHWRKNLPVLGETNRVFAIDLIGFGLSAKPAPGDPLHYRFETWADQIADFCREVIQSPVFLVGNSIGCIVALQTAVSHPEWIKGVAMLNCSLRMLHERKRVNLPRYRQVTSVWLQQILQKKAIGHYFFSRIARPKVIRNILMKAYGRKEAVTEELVQLLLKPAAEEGAADIFLAFINYAQGPLAEDLLPQVGCPILILWGTLDPWEPIALGKAYADYPAVEKFIPLEGVGHCPQDEAPELVNPILQTWISSHSAAD